MEMPPSARAGWIMQAQAPIKKTASAFFLKRMEREVIIYSHYLSVTELFLFCIIGYGVLKYNRIKYKTSRSFIKIRKITSDAVKNTGKQPRRSISIKLIDTTFQHVAIVFREGVHQKNRCI